MVGIKAVRKGDNWSETVADTKACDGAIYEMASKVRALRACARVCEHVWARLARLCGKGRALNLHVLRVSYS